jgi:hypothetical protein
LRRASTAIGFLLFNFDLEYLERLQSSEPLHTKMPPPSSPASLAHGFYRIRSSHWLAHFYLMKKSVKVPHYFGLDCGMLEFFKHFTHEPSSKEQLLTLPYFWSPVWWKRFQFVLIQYNPSFQGLSNGTTLLQILSGRTVPLKNPLLLPGWF